MNKILQYLCFTLLLLLTLFGICLAIASSQNYSITRGMAISFSIFDIGLLFFTKKTLKLPIYIFYIFIILNVFSLFYAGGLMLSLF